MVNDQEPRYRLVDADGNVVGSLFAESDGTLKLQEGTSGNDNELSLTTQGALEVEQSEVGPSGKQTAAPLGRLAGLRTRQRVVPLDSTDATTWVEVEPQDQRTALLFAANDRGSCGLWAFPAAVDTVSKTDTDGNITKNAAGFELEFRLNSGVLEMRAASSGPEGNDIGIWIADLDPSTFTN